MTHFISQRVIFHILGECCWTTTIQQEKSNQTGLTVWRYWEVLGNFGISSSDQLQRSPGMTCNSSSIPLHCPPPLPALLGFSVGIQQI